MNERRFVSWRNYVRLATRTAGWIKGKGQHFVSQVTPTFVSLVRTFPSELVKTLL